MIKCIVIIIGIICFTSCRHQEKQICQYKLAELLKTDSSRVYISYVENHKLIEVRDKVTDSTSGPLYTFDKSGNLRFYAFMRDKSNYKYSEEYDSLGGLIKKEGTPLVEYRLWKKNNDTVVFSVFFFSLQKRFENLEVITNKGDTLEPKLINSKLYTNTKCFSFTLPVAKGINELILYTKGNVINTCTQNLESFVDTTSFKEINL